MKKCLVPHLLLLFGLFGMGPVFAQDRPSSEQEYDQPVRNTIQSYYQSIGENSHLYTGAEYVSPVYLLAMHPFYISFYLANGSINYNGVFYPEVPMSYDILHDVIVINRYNQNFKIQLFNEKIDSFSLLNHHFIRMVPDSSNYLIISPGFYDLLYDGKVKVYAKRIKKLEETLEYNVSVSKIVEDDHFFVFKENIFYFINSKGTLFALFKDKSKEIRRYLRANKIKFRTNPEGAIVKGTEYYDNLKK